MLAPPGLTGHPAWLMEPEAGTGTGVGVLSNLLFK